MTADVRVCADLADLSRRAADAVVDRINQAVRTRGTCSIALSGWDSPRTLYRLLASWLPSPIPWARVHVLWGDERYVPPEDPRSNFGMAQETLLDHVPCPSANVHRMPTQFADADLAARDYERTLRSRFDGEWPDFDLVLLGLGDDGHTASLFPGSLALAEKTRWVVATTVPAEPPLRLTLTLPALVGAAAIYVLAAGSNKAPALRHALEGVGDWIRYPAAGLRLGTGTVIWWVDREAAGLAHDTQTRDDVRPRV